MILHEPRYIIQTDIDFFYGQVEQLENPSLAQKPFGIQQKHIIVTCNYLARAKGVGKLQLVTEALKRCPVILNGEDLERYRAASKKIFHLARSMVWGEKVERLGLDELFFGTMQCNISSSADVTDMINAHMTDLESSLSSVPITGLAFFNISAPGMLPSGFHYKRKTWAGHCISLSGDHLFDPSHTSSTVHVDRTLCALYATSHLAAHVRSTIRTALGFTCSAGAATSKMMAKLAADVHKPDSQTLLLPEAYAEFVGKVPVRKLMGIGWKTARVLGERLQEGEEMKVGERKGGEEEKLMKEMDTPDAWVKSKITAGFVRERASRARFEEWFGRKAGGRMWDLLNGDDDSEVTPTPLIPTQISIEDSFQHCTTFTDATTRLMSLATDLIRRLEIDLVDLKTGDWVQYPRVVRLTTRARTKTDDRAWKERRESRSAPMPVEIFEVKRVEIEERAKKLVEASLLSLLKKLVKEPFAVTLFNIAATHLSIEKPTSSIANFFSSATSYPYQQLEPSQNPPIRATAPTPSTSSSSIVPLTSRALTIRSLSPPADVDLSVWRELPYEIQTELAEQYGMESRAAGPVAQGGDGNEIEGAIERQVLEKKRGIDTKEIPGDKRRRMSMGEVLLVKPEGDHEPGIDEGGLSRHEEKQDGEQETKSHEMGKARELDDPYIAENGSLESGDGEAEGDSYDGIYGADGDYVCPVCKMRMFVWCRDAHEVFHQQKER
ncbi:hypothetical protein BC937DRAFT_90660 [Endogone sp. FLAS-F59071]|nr:hypothetical protein BC937DRAFT_90660 [Endogone sp. FLAS-F59071]|eukprot:RUS16910.1 hypothetical protein BC937DRAFT_90660 [Endogone sp. FLAS-F59071]